MDLHDLRLLSGASAEGLFDDASIARSGELLVLRPDPELSDTTTHAVLAEAATNVMHAPTVVVLVDESGALAVDQRFAALAHGVDVALTALPDPPKPWVCAPLDPLIENVAAHPLAAFALVSLLRSGDGLPVWNGLAAEAATYGMLLGGHDFAAWLTNRGPAAVRPNTRESARLDRSGDTVRITLDRPEARNALDSTMRDALVAAFATASEIVRSDDRVTAIVLDGEGPSFCAGGDLAEFGTAADGPAAMAARMTRHPGWSAHQVCEHLTAYLHGHCIGSGIEVPAFAGRVLAAPDTLVRLPELSMGLIPGAGGTVSIPRRIGRQRTAWLALSMSTIDADQALAWGLIDEIIDELAR